MTQTTHPVTEVFGTSDKSMEDAIRGAIATTSETIRNLEWFEVTQMRGKINDKGEIDHFQVGVKLGFRLDR
ncbi:dodecin [Roseovarius sp. Pro17]|uniref:dodecin n=1 Tax=Roseovarius sp. Pro17 TaxID=3108175 RepID=UPI002D784D8C|nr:dodecin [Roseovarius sp. Pro17]